MLEPSEELERFLFQELTEASLNFDGSKERKLQLFAILERLDYCLEVTSGRKEQ